MDVIQSSLAEVLKCFPARAAVLLSVFVPVAALDTQWPSLLLLNPPPFGLGGGRLSLTLEADGLWCCCLCFTRTRLRPVVSTCWALTVIKLENAIFTGGLSSL